MSVRASHTCLLLVNLRGKTERGEMEMALTLPFKRVPIAIGLCYNVDVSIFGMVYLFCL